MHVPLFDHTAAAEELRSGDGAQVEAVSQLLGVELDEPAVAALLTSVDVPLHPSAIYGARAKFPLADALAVIAEAAASDGGVATREVRPWSGKVVAVAYRKGDTVWFGAGCASNSSLPMSQIWSELRPWYKKLDRNRKRLDTWVEREEGVIALQVRERTGPTDERETHMAAVLADPDDRALRLVLADWLVEQGDAQGQMIQLGEATRIAVAQGERARAAELREQLKPMVAQHGDRIAGDVAQLAKSYGMPAGFVESVVMQANTFATHGERLLDAHPIRTLEVATVTASGLRRLPGAKALPRVRHLVLRQKWRKGSPVDLEPLCTSGNLTGLERLDLDHCNVGGDAVGAFARLDAPALRALHISGSSSFVPILEGLSKNPHIHLTELHLDLGSFAERPAWTGPLTGPAFEGLEVLALGQYRALLGAEVLLDGAVLPCLRDLATPLLDDRALPALERLALLRGAAFDEAALMGVLERSPRLRTLLVHARDTLDEAAWNRVAEALLALPDDHPLRVVKLDHVANADLLARLRERFARWE